MPRCRASCLILGTYQTSNAANAASTAMNAASSVNHSSADAPLAEPVAGVADEPAVRVGPIDVGAPVGVWVTVDVGAPPAVTVGPACALCAWVPSCTWITSSPAQIQAAAMASMAGKVRSGL